MTTLFTPPTSIVTSAFKFTAPEKQRLSAAKDELQRLDGLLGEIVKTKDVIDSAAEDFAAGRISIRETIGLIAAAGDSAARAELEGKLRRPIKAALKATVAAVADLVDKSRNHHVAELESKAQHLESSERGVLDGLGIGQEDFAPSLILRGMIEQWRRAKADSQQPPARDALNRVLLAVG